MEHFKTKLHPNSHHLAISFPSKIWFKQETTGAKFRPIEWMNEWMNERTNERTSERTNKQMNEWVQRP